MPTAIVVIADGSEELEAVAPIDLLRRAGVSVTIAGVPSVDVSGRSGLQILADVPLEAIAEEEYDLIVLPGGPAFKRLRHDETLRALLSRHVAAGKPIGAICAAPTILADAGLLAGRSFTAHFSVADELVGLDSSRAVVEDGCLITSQGAGTAIEFALALVRRLLGEAAAAEVAESICFRL